VTDGPEPRPTTGVRRRRAAIVATFLAVMVVLVAVPGRAYLNQRGEVASAQDELRRLEASNERLQRRKDRLEDPAEIQRIARRDYGLVAVGEESYTVLPPATAGLALPDAWPYDRLAEAVRAAAGGT
jgi:cell division protein FtsB